MDRATGMAGDGKGACGQSYRNAEMVREPMDGAAGMVADGKEHGLQNVTTVVKSSVGI